MARRLRRLWRLPVASSLGTMEERTPLLGFIYIFTVLMTHICAADAYNWSYTSLDEDGQWSPRPRSPPYMLPLPVPRALHHKRTSSGSDLVSRNITMVLENLLKNYESSQPPPEGKGKPTVVRTNILIRSMGPVSELDMDYSMDCYFRQYWRDSRLSFSGAGHIKSLSLSIKMLERIWRPDTYFHNGKNSYVHTITVPNKLLRIGQDGEILYSMRLTIKANCPMELRNFPMDRQSCPLIIGSYAYTSKQLVYQWQTGNSVNFVPGMALSQFDLMGSPQRNGTFIRREGEFSVLQVNFNLQRHTGYFLIQVYVPCILIVVLSWVSFWIHREATADRVGLGITTVLTLSTISLDSRTDLPKVRYATALDWFLLMSFFYCIATLLEFAGVHYFTKEITENPDRKRINMPPRGVPQQVYPSPLYILTLPFTHQRSLFQVICWLSFVVCTCVLRLWCGSSSHGISVGSGEIPIDEDEWEENELEAEANVDGGWMLEGHRRVSSFAGVTVGRERVVVGVMALPPDLEAAQPPPQPRPRRRSSTLICPIYNPGASQIQGNTGIVAPVPVFLNPEGSSSGGSAFASPVSRTSAQPQQPQPTLSTQQEEPSDWSSAEGSIQPVLSSPQAQHFSHNRAVEIPSTMDSPQVRSIAQVTTATTSTVNSVPGGRLYLRTVVERQTQTEKRIPCWRQLLYCLAGDDRFRRQRQRQAAAEAAMALKLTGGRANGVARMAGLSSATAGRVNSVSQIDRAARILFPASFGLLNLFYWTGYVIAAGNEFTWKDVPGIKN